MRMVVKVGLSDKVGAIKSHRKNISPPHILEGSKRIIDVEQLFADCEVKVFL